MARERAKRKLTAILSADVKGYSRLMGEDELSTVETLKVYREVIVSLAQQYSGRVVDSPGDNILAEFGSVVDAVECAVKIQEELQDKNASLPESRRMEFRVGVNLGDVIHDEGRIYGDGVNIAARIEGLAEGGGICISRMAFDNVRNKLNLGYEYLGEHSVKNIAQPVRVYKVLMEPGSAGKVIGEARPRRVATRYSAVAAVVAIVVIAGALAFWYFQLRRPPVEPASQEKMAFPLPDKPSIAVLAFTNMSRDPKDDPFGDGLADGIIDGLSKSEHLFVIARNSSFTYKGKPVNVKQVAEDLGVRYVLEGSIQKAGDRVRITAQLIDAVAGHHLFSERYDRDLKSILDLQDEITMKVVTAVRVKLTAGEAARISAKGTKNLDAFLKVLQASEYTSGTFNKERVERAIELLEEAIALDPEYAHAYSILSTAHFELVVLGASDSPRESLQRAVELGKKAVALDEFSSHTHANLAFTYIYLRKSDKAMEEAEKSISLGPNSAHAYFALGTVLNMVGRHQEAIPVLQKSLRLSPIPITSHVLGTLGSSYSLIGQYEEGVAMYKKQLQLYGPDHLMAHLGLAANYAMMGHEREARSEGAEILRIDPKFSLERYMKGSPRDQASKDRLTEALRKAGLPDKPPLPLPDKPSIAVLPFVNMSDDKSQEYFSDGLTEEIITALSKTPKLFVIASNSSFVYKGKPVNVQRVSRELGVKYFLEGSVRRSGDQLRITAQLIEATTGNHLWAERYDTELKDLFSLQDEITMKIITALEVNLTEGEQALVTGSGTHNLDAYLKTLQARELKRNQTVENNHKARRLAEEAISLDPGYAQAYRWLSGTYVIDVWLGSTKSPQESLNTALELVQKALSLDDSLGGAHGLLGNIYVLRKEYEKGVREAERAVELEPNGADAHAFLGMALRFADRAEEAIPMLKKAIRLDPHSPEWYLNVLAGAYRDTEKYEEAIEWGEKAVQQNPRNVLCRITLCSIYSLTGQVDKARAQGDEIMKLNPKFSVTRFAITDPQKNQVLKERYIGALREAGLPD